MGRKPSPLISANFRRGAKLENSSNRYEQTCIHCAKFFPKGRHEVLASHLSKCPALSPESRISLLNQADQLPLTDTHPHEQPYAQKQNAGLQQLADVAEAAGAATLRNLLQADNGIPLDPQLSAPNHQNGAPLVVPQFGDRRWSGNDHGFYIPATPFPASALDSQTSSSSSVYPSLTGPPLTTESSPYPPFAGLIAPSFPNSFNQFSAPEQISTTITDALTSVDAGADFDVFVPSANDAIAQPIDPLETSFAQQGDGTQHVSSASPKKSASKPRKPKEPYSADQRKKISDMRRRKPCIRCSRLQKSCSVEKPCAECLKVQSSKNWRGPCTQFRNSGDFDEWYGQPTADQLNLLMRQVDTEFVRENNTNYLAKVTLEGILSDPITFPIVRAVAPIEQDNVWLPDETFDFKNVVLNYIRTNVDDIISNLDRPELSMILNRASELTKGRKVPLSKVVLGQQLDGDDNMRQLIELWLAVYLRAKQTWSIKIQDSTGGLIDNESQNACRGIKVKLSVSLETIIAEHRIGPLPAKENDEELEYGGTIFNFDITRLSSSSHREFYNLLIGIVLILSAVERYCALTRSEQGVLPDEYRHKAEEYVRKYIYAIQGISILPALITQEDPAVGTVIVAKHDQVEGNGNKHHRTVNYSMTRAFIAMLQLNPDVLRSRVASVDSAWDGDTGAWHGWLWSRVFLVMLE